MDHEIDLVCELEPDDLEQIACMVGSDRKDLWWISVGFQVDDGESMVEGMAASDTPRLRADRWISTCAIS